MAPGTQGTLPKRTLQEAPLLAQGHSAASRGAVTSTWSVPSISLITFSLNRIRTPAGPWGPLGLHHPSAHLHLLLPLPGAHILPSLSSIHIIPPWPVLLRAPSFENCPPRGRGWGPGPGRVPSASLLCEAGQDRLQGWHLGGECLSFPVYFLDTSSSSTPYPHQLVPPPHRLQPFLMSPAHSVFLELQG